VGFVELAMRGPCRPRRQQIEQNWLDERGAGAKELSRLGKGQGKSKHRAAARPIFSPDPAAVAFHDRSNDRKPEPQTLLLGREERLENAVQLVVWNAGARVDNRYLGGRITGHSGLKCDLALAGRSANHGVHSVQSKIQQDLFEVHQVGTHAERAISFIGGTAIAARRARHAQDAGAAAVIAATPYYWTPPAAMVLEHFVQIGSAIEIPFLLYNSPEEFPGNRINADFCLKLIETLPNFVGVVDLSLDWQFMIELMTFAPQARTNFQLLAGTEHMVSAAAIGATGVFSPLAPLSHRSFPIVAISRRRARASRDITVPMGTSVVSAISR
jgi:hypothetical protein